MKPWKRRNARSPMQSFPWERRRARPWGWWLAVLLGLASHLLFLLLLNPVFPALVPEELGRMPVALAPEGALETSEIMREQALLMDSAPLFLPTSWNASTTMPPPRRPRTPMELAQAFPPETGLPGRPEEALGLVASSPGPEALRRTILEGPELLLEAYGKTFVSEASPLEGDTDPGLAPVFFVRVERLDSPAIPAELLPLDLARRSEGDGLLRAPVVVLLDLESAGVPSTLPILVSSSGDPEWDRRVIDRLGERRFQRSLGQGYFRLTVGQ